MNLEAVWSKELLRTAEDMSISETAFTASREKAYQGWFVLFQKRAVHYWISYFWGKLRNQHTFWIMGFHPLRSIWFSVQQKYTQVYTQGYSKQQKWLTLSKLLNTKGCGFWPQYSARQSASWKIPPGLSTSDSFAWKWHLDDRRENMLFQVLHIEGETEHKFSTWTNLLTVYKISPLKIYESQDLVSPMEQFIESDG